MEISPKLLVVLISLSIVCILSIAGSFINWMANEFGHCDGDPDRWKWMSIVSMVITVLLFFSPIGG